MIIYSFFEEKKNANKIHIHMTIMKIFEKNIASRIAGGFE